VSLGVGFAIPYIFFHLFTEQQLEAIAENTRNHDEESADKGIDYQLWEVRGRREFWFYVLLTFLLVGVSRVIQENTFILSIGQMDRGIELLHSFKAFQLVGVMLVGLTLIFFRWAISPSGMIIFMAFLMCAA
jgi:hypothetical protein